MFTFGMWPEELPEEAVGNNYSPFTPVTKRERMMLEELDEAENSLDELEVCTLPEQQRRQEQLMAIDDRIAGIHDKIQQMTAELDELQQEKEGLKREVW